MKENDPADGASPPCLMDEADPAYFGYLGRAELIDLLNLLLECERAGARGVAALAGRSADPGIRDAFREIAADEARFCVMLSSHIKGLLGTPSEDTGGFYRKLIALDALDTQLDLLDRGQSWVADKLREALPKISQAGLHRDLAEMLVVHESNIERARRLSIPTGDHG
jgi:nitronate monooxygenase